MRMMFAHDAVIEIADDGDVGAPGASITAAVCGTLHHEGPCPLAPHHTSAQIEGSQTLLRILFATEPDDEGQVRELIAAALNSGQYPEPDGTVVHWQVISSQASPVKPSELVHAARLVAT